MGFFSFLSNVVHTVSHPIQALTQIKNVVVKAEKAIEKTVVKAATVVEKVGEVVVKDATKAIDFVEDHAKEIKKVVDITAKVVEFVGTATGQPEIVAGAEILRRGADRALDLAGQAKAATDVVQKATLVAKSIRQKEKLSTTIHKVSDTMMSAGHLRGDKNLIEMAGHIKLGAGVVDRAINHSKDIHAIAMDTIKAAQTGDIGGVIQGVQRGVAKQQVVKGETQQLLDFLRKQADTDRVRAQAELVRAEAELVEEKEELLEEQLQSPREFLMERDPAQFTVGLESPQQFLEQRVKPKPKPRGKRRKPLPLPKKLIKPKTKSKKVSREMIEGGRPIVSALPRIKAVKQKKRKLSAYNIFMSKTIKSGKTFKEAVALWRAQK